MSNFVRLQAAEVAYRLNETSIVQTLDAQRQALDSALKLAAADPKNQRYAMDVPLIRQWVADKLSKNASIEDALAHLSQAETEMTNLAQRGNDATISANNAGIVLQRRTIVAKFLNGDLQSAQRRLMCERYADSLSTANLSRQRVNAESQSLLPTHDEFHKLRANALARCERVGE